jgi:hypothetical protein
MDGQDVQLTFDPKMMMDALGAITQKLTDLEGKFTKVADSTTKMEKHGAISIGLWTNLISRGFDIASAGIRRMLEFIPEVGRTFQIAGDIISRNLLWPLRQELIPLLQGFLNWVRDHRAMFVQWGTVIANIFRVLKTIAGTFFQMFQRVWERVSGVLKRLFGGTAKSVSELLNILLFKFTVLVIGAQAIIEPLLDFMIDIWEKVAKVSKAFFDGVFRGARGISEPIMGIVAVLKEFGSIFSEAFSGIGSLKDIFSDLGHILGTSIKLGLEGLLFLLTGIIATIKAAKISIDYLKGSITGEQLAKKFEEIDKDFQQKTSKQFGRAKEALGMEPEKIEEVEQGDKGKMYRITRNEKGEVTKKEEIHNTNVGTINVSLPNVTADDAAKNLVPAIKKEIEKNGGAAQR